MFTRIALIAVGLMSVGCKPKDGEAEYRAMEAEVLGRHRPALAARLATLKAVQAAARQRPPLSPLEGPDAPRGEQPVFLAFAEDEVLDRKRALERDTGCRFFFDSVTLSKLNGEVGFWPSKELSPDAEK